MIENLPLMLEKLSEAKKPDDVRNYLLPLLGRALAQEKQTNLQVNILKNISRQNLARFYYKFRRNHWQ